MEPKKVRIIKEKPVLPTLYKNVGIYCRVSSNTQEQLNSMAAQVSFLFSSLVVDFVNIKVRITLLSLILLVITKITI